MGQAETMIGRVRERLAELEARAAAWREQSATLHAMARWREEILAIFGELDFAQRRALFAGLGPRVVVHPLGAPARLEVYLQIKLDRRLYRGFTAQEVERAAELLSVSKQSYFEMLHEPPGLSADDFQWYLAEPRRVNADGDIVAPDRPGLGVEPTPTSWQSSGSRPPRGRSRHVRRTRARFRRVGSSSGDAARGYGRALSRSLAARSGRGRRRCPAGTGRL
jgi:hypothetical protein